jgi:hypothetical protein
MPSPLLSPNDARAAPRESMEGHHRRVSDKEELRQNIAQLKLGEECLRRKRLLGSAATQDYETYSLPVSRVTSTTAPERKQPVLTLFT